MEHILIVTYAMLPYAESWGGCQRMFYLAKHLTEKGQKVSIVCHKSEAINMFGQHPVFDVYSVDDAGAFEKVRFDGINSATQLRPKINSSPSVLSKIKRNRLVKWLGLKYLESVYNNPSPLLGRRSWRWSKTAYNAIDSFVHENCITKVIISAPPFGMFRLVTMLRKTFGEKVDLFMDYRDPWNLWKKGGALSRGKERKALRDATQVIVTNSNMKKGLHEKFAIPLDKIEVVANGYSEESWKNVQGDVQSCDSREMKFFHIGSVSLKETDSFRNPKTMIEAFRSLSVKHPEISLCFVGVDESEIFVANQISKDTQERIRFVKNVNQQRSFQYMLEADVLVQLHDSKDDSAKYLISGKVYDYIRAQKTILAVGNLDGATQSLINELDIGYTAKNSVEDITAVVEEMYEQWKHSGMKSLRSECDIVQYSREYQNERYIQLILK